MFSEGKKNEEIPKKPEEKGVEIALKYFRRELNKRLHPDTRGQVKSIDAGDANAIVDEVEKKALEEISGGGAKIGRPELVYDKEAIISEIKKIFLLGDILEIKKVLDDKEKEFTRGAGW